MSDHEPDAGHPLVPDDLVDADAVAATEVTEAADDERVSVNDAGEAAPESGASAPAGRRRRKRDLFTAPLSAPASALGGLVESAARTTGEQIDQAVRSAETARVVSSANDRFNRFRRERKVGKGTLRSTHVETFTGYVADGVANIWIRVVEQPVVPELPEGVDDIPYADLIRSNVRRFFALPLPGMRVVIDIGSQDVEVVTDRRGFAKAELPIGQDGDVPSGWLTYTCTTLPDDPDEQPIVNSGRILAARPAATFAVISDIDDTILRTGLTEGFTAVRRTLLGNAQTRRPVPGMSTLYRALSRHDQDGIAFAYVSTGPWPLYELLTGFMAVNGFPKGPLFLTDWSPNERYLLRSGREHKRKSLNLLMRLSPEVPFVLIGDGGQGDPDVYLEAYEANPGRVKAIVLLDVGPHLADRAQELRDQSAELQAKGVPYFFVDDAADAAAALAKLGLITDDDVFEVGEATRDEA